MADIQWTCSRQKETSNKLRYQIKKPCVCVCVCVCARVYSNTVRDPPNVAAEWLAIMLRSVAPGSKCGPETG
jgi:hypothetical protein